VRAGRDRTDPIPTVRLIDLGLDDRFGTAMSFAEALISSINVSGIRADVEYLRTADASLVVHALTVPAQLIHIMGHGGTCQHGAPALSGQSDSGDRAVVIDLDHLAKHLQAHHRGISATAVFADACCSAQHSFGDALRETLESPIVYIGATRDVDWHECTTFDAILYGSMLNKKGKDSDQLGWMYDAAMRSVEAYMAAVAGPCPFLVAQLSPSRRAQEAFRE
jgi:hypothetical protein